jgi:predicted acylesterase/phospholipase RssA
MSRERDVGIVMSGGGMTGILMELGFLQRLRLSPLWRRVGWVYGTSAGALAGVSVALDRLDQLEEFLYSLAPDEAFRPHRIWQTPFTGLHDYALPETIAARLGPIEVLMAELAESPIELVVSVTDVAQVDESAAHAFERAYSSRTTPPETMGRAVLASAAISALVLPLRVGETIGTDGGWVRNFPLGYAYDNPDVRQIVGFRYLSRARQPAGENLVRIRKRLERFRAVPPIRALIGELQEAEERQARGEPAHLADMILRLMRVAIARNTAVEERVAADKDASVAELAALRRDILAISKSYALPGRRSRLAAAIEDRFDAARFPFDHDRNLPTVIVHGDPGEYALEPGFRAGLEWPTETKRALIELGFALTDAELARHGVDDRKAA